MLRNVFWEGDDCMNCSRINELEKENAELKQKLKETNKEYIINRYKQYIHEMDEEVEFLRDRLENNAVMIHINAQKNRFISEESIKPYPINECRTHIKIPISAIRIKGMPSNFIKEFSPQSMNSMIAQIESDLRDRLIILVKY